MRVKSTTTAWKGMPWALVAAVALAFLMAMGAAPTQAQAAQSEEALAAGSVQVTTQDKGIASLVDRDDLWAGNKNNDGLYNFVTWDAARLTNVTVTSSNPSVLKVEKLDSTKNLGSYNIVPLKVGKAKLTVKFKDEETNQKDTISRTYTVKAFSDGVASMKLNNTALPVPTSKSSRTEFDVYNYTGTTTKLTVATKNGWAVTWMSGEIEKVSNGTSKSIEVENGKSFTIPKGYEGYIDVSLYKESTDEYFDYRVRVYRNGPIVADKGSIFIGHPTMPYLFWNGVDAYTAKVISVKSSKPGVIKATFKKNKGVNKITLSAKKAGTSKITIKYKVGNKTYTTKANYTAVTFPLASVKVNGKAINLKKNESGITYNRYAKSNARVNAKAGKGWKLLKITTWVNGKEKKLKNGAKIATKKNTSVTVAIHLKKGKMTYTYFIEFSRY